MAAPPPPADASVDAGAGVIPAAVAAVALHATVPAHALARLRYTRLAGDHVNGTWRIDADARRYVLRVRAPRSSLPGVDRARELAAQRCAAAAGLAPRVLAGDAAAGWLLMELVDAAPWSDADFGDAARLAALGARLASLHALAAPDVAPLDASGIAAGQLAVIRAHDAGAAAKLARLGDEVRALTAELDEPGARRVLNHGDLMAGNVLGPGAVLIDWEYAQLTDASYDLACLLDYYPQARAHAGQLMAVMGQHHAGAREKLALQLRRFRILNQLWQAAAAAGKMVGSTNQ